jgi:hypothetical protein
MFQKPFPQVDFGFAKFIKPGHKTWTFAGTPEVSLWKAS